MTAATTGPVPGVKSQPTITTTDGPIGTEEPSIAASTSTGVNETSSYEPLIDSVRRAAKTTGSPSRVGAAMTSASRGLSVAEALTSAPSTPADTATRVAKLLRGPTGNIREKRILDLLAACGPHELDAVVRELSNRGLLRKLLKDVDGRESARLVSLLGYYLRDPEVVISFFDAMHAVGLGDRQRILSCFANAERRGELEALHAAVVASGKPYTGGRDLSALRAEIAATVPFAKEEFPFSQGMYGGLSPKVDFSRFLDPSVADPTEATAAASASLLTEYFKTGQFGEIAGKEGVPLRYAVFAPPAGLPIKGVINISTGVTESLTKHAELIFNLRHLRAQGYAVAIMDHRGQGFSGRLLADRGKAHAEVFDHFVQDQAAFRAVLEKNLGPATADRRYTLIGHSMGGGIATRYCEKHPEDYDNLILLAPMLNVNSGMADWLETVAANAVAPFMPTSYALGQGPYKPDDPNAAPATTCPGRAALHNEIRETYPETKLGGPTWNWSKESINATRTMMRHRELDKLRSLESIQIFSAGADTFVDNKSHAELARYLGCPYKSDWNGLQPKHELLSEVDAVRDQVVSQIKKTVTAGTTN